MNVVCSLIFKFEKLIACLGQLFEFYHYKVERFCCLILKCTCLSSITKKFWGFAAHLALNNKPLNYNVWKTFMASLDCDCYCYFQLRCLFIFHLVENTCKILVPVERKRILPFSRGRFTPFGKMKDHSSLKMYIWIMILHILLFETIYIQLATLSPQLNNADSIFCDLFFFRMCYRSDRTWLFFNWTNLASPPVGLIVVTSRLWYLLALYFLNKEQISTPEFC